MLTAERARQLLDYNAETGELTWRSRGDSEWDAKYSGKAAGKKYPRGYVVVRINKKSYRAHRLAWLITTGRFPKEQLDHINCIKDDNRLQNLRECSNAENQRNIGIKPINKSGFKGVSWDSAKNKWRARIKTNYKEKMLGTFDDPQEASKCYAEAAKRLHKEFARLA